jgi:hypothetical protein
MSQAESSQAEPEYELKGIGGWLILPLLHLVANAGMIAVMVVTSFLEGYDMAEAQGTPDGGGDGGTPDVLAELSALFTPAFLASIGVLLIASWVFLFAIFCLVRFFQKKKHVPKLMIGFYVLLVALTVANAAALHWFPELSMGPDDMKDAMIGLVRVGIAAAIWIPYFLVSERVKNTFVR